MKNSSKILELNKDHYEINLLTELSHEISNFKEGFKGSVNHTFILAPWASSLFGFEIDNNKAYIGVPSIIYDNLSLSSLYLVNYIKNKPGIFVVFDLGGENKKRPVALRIHMRTKRVESLAKFKKITFIRMDLDGNAEPGFDEDEFELDFKEVKDLDWEYFGKK